MNYSRDDLHSKITQLHSFCSKHLKDFNHFTQTLTFYNKYTIEYIDNLKQLKNAVMNLNLDNLSSNSIYEISMKTLLRFITQQIEALEIYSEGMKNGIIDELNKVIVLQSTNKTLYDNFSKLEQEITNEANAVTTLQNEYLNKMRAFETIIIDHLMKKPSLNECDISINEGITARNTLEAHYMTQIGRVNNVRNKYNSLSAGFLAKYKEIFDTVENKYLNGFNLLLNIITLKSVQDKYVINDIQQTIPLINESQLENPPKLFEKIEFDEMIFQPYQLAILNEKKKGYALNGNSNNNSNRHSIKNNNNSNNRNSISIRNQHQEIIDNVLVYNVVTFMQKNFFKIAENYNAPKEKKKNEILRISHLICENLHNTPLSNEDKSIIETLFKFPEYRLIFLTYLNNKRVEGCFNLCKESFNQLGDIMRYIIDCIEKDKEYESMRYCLIMCQTYWFTDSNNERIYLQAKIEDHPLFQNEDFWLFFFSDSLHQEITKQGTYSDKQKENDEEKNHRFGNIAFSQLISLGHSMMDFNVDKAKIKKIITIFAKQYHVSQELIEQIYELINEVVYEEKEKKQQSPIKDGDDTNNNALSSNQKKSINDKEKNVTIGKSNKINSQNNKDIKLNGKTQIINNKTNGNK